MSKTKMQNSIDTQIENPIVIAMSGGVDSSVAAALMKKKQVTLLA